MPLTLYQSIGPNPRIVLFFLEEKQIEVKRRFIDIVAGENRKAPYLAKNRFGQVPLLELDNGETISKSVVICEYLDEENPGNSLIGENALARARTREFLRRLESNVFAPMAAGFRGAEGNAMFKDRMLCLPQIADEMKGEAQKGFAMFDDILSDGRAFLTGDNFTLADIVLFCSVEFGKSIGQAPKNELTHLAKWSERIAQRPAATASMDAKKGCEEQAG